MITINIIRDKESFIWQFKIEGHAGFAEAGSDIICAAVSVTAYNAVGALEDIAGIKKCYKEKDGYMLCSIPTDVPESKKHDIKVILETTLIGFKQIEHQYENYVRVLDEEV